MGKSKKYGMNTKALHANKRFEPISGDVMPPLHLSTTYKNDVPVNQIIFMEELTIQQGSCLKEPWRHLKVLKIMRSSMLLRWHQECQL